ncbi:hypothetical protein CITRIK5_30006 [Citricoccus sp. K5]|nr:hypothetical protein CITRIK5_30006 [Citricoccus sp. K5]
MLCVLLVPQRIFPVALNEPAVALKQFHYLVHRAISLGCGNFGGYFQVRPRVLARTTNWCGGVHEGSMRAAGSHALTQPAALIHTRR